MVGSDTMRADLELRRAVILREDTLREVGAGGWQGGEGRGMVSRRAVYKHKHNLCSTFVMHEDVSPSIVLCRYSRSIGRGGRGDTASLRGCTLPVLVLRARLGGRGSAGPCIS